MFVWGVDFFDRNKPKTVHLYIDDVVISVVQKAEKLFY